MRRPNAAQLACGILLMWGLALSLLMTRQAIFLPGWRVNACGLVVSLLTGTLLFAGITRRRPHAVQAAWLVSPALWLVIAQAAAEEVIWRGWLLHRGCVLWGMPLAIGVTVIAFALYHYPLQGWRGVRQHLLTGSAFTAAYVLGPGLVAAVTTHAIYNIWALTARKFLTDAALQAEAA